MLGSRLQTCDITKEFLLQREDGAIQRFDIITAWEVLEHIAECDLPQLFKNIKRHLNPDGYFVGSIANWDDIDPDSGVNWHITVHPYEWWRDIFMDCGFEICTEKFHTIDLARGGYNPPHCYERPYPDVDMQKSFHIVARIPSVNIFCGETECRGKRDDSTMALQQYKSCSYGQKQAVFGEDICSLSACIYFFDSSFHRNKSHMGIYRRGQRLLSSYGTGNAGWTSTVSGSC